MQARLGDPGDPDVGAALPAETAITVTQAVMAARASATLAAISGLNSMVTAIPLLVPQPAADTEGTINTPASGVKGRASGLLRYPRAIRLPTMCG